MKFIIFVLNSERRSMTYLTIEIPDNKLNVIDSISDLLKKEGINTLAIDSEADLSEREFSLLQEGYKEALHIKNGKVKPTPISELWNDQRCFHLKVFSKRS